MSKKYRVYGYIDYEIEVGDDEDVELVVDEIIGQEFESCITWDEIKEDED